MSTVGTPTFHSMSDLLTGYATGVVTPQQLAASLIQTGPVTITINGLFVTFSATAGGTIAQVAGMWASNVPIPATST